MLDNSNSHSIPLKVKQLSDLRGRALQELRISIIDRCNLRCTYCMPADSMHGRGEFLPRKQIINEDEIVRLANAFSLQGVHKLRLTGGEPLLRPDLVSMTRRLAQIEGIDDLALTTNGILLPALAAPLREAGLHRLTVSLDTLDPKIMHKITGDLAEVEQVIFGIEAAVAAGFEAIKINTVVQKGVNDHTIMDLLEHFRGTPHIVRLIEFMDVGTRNHWQPEQVVPSAEWERRIHARWPLQKLDKHHPGATANRYAYKDGHGEVGFISSVSEPFCGGCTRARLTAEGMFYTCLFAHRGVALRPLLRSGASDKQMSEAIARAWSIRDDRYSELRNNHSDASERVEMYRMGG
jgi:cyclic pyranopterin phosphate synthase